METASLSKIEWLNEPEKHDYAAAASYLSLIFNEESVKKIVKQLKRAPVTRYKAKDIFRASQLSLLGVSNFHVAKDQQKIKAGKHASPLLLVRDAIHGKVIVADGYHRLCAVYSFDEDADVSAKIV